MTEQGVREFFDSLDINEKIIDIYFYGHHAAKVITLKQHEVWWYKVVEKDDEIEIERVYRMISKRVW